MKRMMICVAVFLLLVLTVMPASAADGKVTYDGNAQEFVFMPGSDFSPTDLFPNFKDVMPGDTLTQTITVENKASNKVKVKIYLRSLGAHEESAGFLSQLNLRVQKSEDNTMGYMFDATADQTAGLTDWVCLGTLYSGGKVNLDVLLDVPVELDNSYQDHVGYLDWQFKIEEFPIEDSDPKPPPTGVTLDNRVWIVAIGSLAVMILCIVLFFKRKKDDDRNGR